MCSLKRLVLSPHHLPPFHSHYFTSLLWTLVLLQAILSYRRSPGPSIPPLSLSLSLSPLPFETSPQSLPQQPPLLTFPFHPLCCQELHIIMPFKDPPIPTNEPLIFYTYTSHWFLLHACTHSMIFTSLYSCSNSLSLSLSLLFF